MKRIHFVAASAAFLCIALGAGYAYRGNIRDRLYAERKPELPAPVAFDALSDTPASASAAPPSSIEGGMASSEHYVLESSPQATTPKRDPLGGSTELPPPQMNLAVPWMSQAPKANWDYPYQEACEEASMLMVDGFYKKTQKMTPDEADAAILKLVAYEEKTLGLYKDTDAEQTAGILRSYFGYKDVRVIPFQTADDIMQVLGKGFPVIVGFSGKDLQNPNFRNGGPLYHMLVIKGYTADGNFITGDPGTRKGEDYIYPFDRLVEAAHDWNGGDVAHGKKVMIVVMPPSP